MNTLDALRSLCERQPMDRGWCELPKAPNPDREFLEDLADEFDEVAEWIASRTNIGPKENAVRLREIAAKLEDK